MQSVGRKLAPGRAGGCALPEKRLDVFPLESQVGVALKPPRSGFIFKKRGYFCGHVGSS